ncbi:hypothetical protein WME98_42695 [Sorangium sp. So ce296]|uniref:hypothetical protein n=1 Tax=Sorangium sp. So ce296 TaxID=3133296 RepID=UPI003F606F78
MFDSRHEAAERELARHDALLQRFVGWEIEAEAPLFDTGAATLFDSSGAAGHGGDAPSLADVLAIVASLPKLPFLRALAGWLGTRLGLVPPARQLRA